MGYVNIQQQRGGDLDERTYVLNFPPRKLTSLLTTSVFVVAVAVCFTATTDWEPKGIVEYGQDL